MAIVVVYVGFAVGKIVGADDPFVGKQRLQKRHFVRIQEARIQNGHQHTFAPEPLGVHLIDTQSRELCRRRAISRYRVGLPEFTYNLLIISCFRANAHVVEHPPRFQTSYIRQR